MGAICNKKINGSAETCSRGKGRRTGKTNDAFNTENDETSKCGKWIESRAGQPDFARSTPAVDSDRTFFRRRFSFSFRFRFRSKRKGFHYFCHVRITYCPAKLQVSGNRCDLDNRKKIGFREKYLIRNLK